MTPALRTILFGGLRPVLSLDFANGVYRNASGSWSNPADVGLTCTRSTVANDVTNGGVILPFAANVPRIVPGRGLGAWEATTNLIRNPRGEGLTTGVIGSGGAYPTNWSASSGASSFTITVVGSGVADGIPYIDLRLQSASASTSVAFRSETSSGAAVAASTAYTGSVWASYVAGSVANVTAAYAQVETFGGAGSTGGGSTPPSAGAMQRLSVVPATTPVGATFARTNLVLSFTPGAAVDITIRYGGFQLVQKSFLVPPLWPPSGIGAATYNADNNTVPDVIAAGQDFTIDNVTELPGTTGVAQFLFDHHDGTDNNRIYCERTSTGNLRPQVVIGGVSTLIGFVAKTGARTVITRISRSGNVYSFWADGALIGSQTLPGMPALSGLQIGARRQALFPLNGYTQSHVHYPRAL